MTVDKAKQICEATAAVAMQQGASEVIVMIGLPDGEHSAYFVKYYGACLPVRGLLEIGAESVRKQLVFPISPSKQVQPNIAEAVPAKNDSHAIVTAHDLFERYRRIDKARQRD